MNKEAVQKPKNHNFPKLLHDFDKLVADVYYSHLVNLVSNTNHYYQGDMTSEELEELKIRFDYARILRNQAVICKPEEAKS